MNGTTKEAYAARFQRTLTGASGKTLTVHSGGIILDQNTSATAPGNVSLDVLGLVIPTGVEAFIYAGRSAGQTHTIGGNITADTGLTKSGPATLALSGANDWTGATQADNVLTINAGTLRLDGGSMPSDSWVHVADGGTFSINALSPTVLGLAGEGGNQSVK